MFQPFKIGMFSIIPDGQLMSDGTWSPIALASRGEGALTHDETATYVGSFSTREEAAVFAKGMALKDPIFVCRISEVVPRS